MTVKELHDMLPSSWKELKLKDFQKITSIEISEFDGLDGMFVGVDNTLKLISSLTGVSIEELESLPISIVNQLAKKVSFITKLPAINKNSSLKWKKHESLTYGEFVAYQNLSKSFFQNMHLIIQNMSVKELTIDEVLELNMEDVLTGFFLLQKQTRRFVRYMKAYLLLKWLKQITMQTFKMLTHFKQT